MTSSASRIVRAILPEASVMVTAKREAGEPYRRIAS